MPRRWSEPGWDRWAKIAAWVLLGAVVGYFAVRLGTSLAQRFGAIKRSYEVPAAPEEAPGRRGGACLPGRWESYALATFGRQETPQGRRMWRPCPIQPIACSDGGAGGEPACGYGCLSQLCTRPLSGSKGVEGV